MTCCNETVNYGCGDACQDFFFDGITAPIDGFYTFRGYFVNGGFFLFGVDMLAGETLYIPGGTLNETKDQEILIFDPNGAPIQFAPGIICSRIQMLIGTEIPVGGA